MKIEMLKPGDPCPCCGQPIKLTDPDALRLLTLLGELLFSEDENKLPDPRGEFDKQEESV